MAQTTVLEAVLDKLGITKGAEAIGEGSLGLLKTLMAARPENLVTMLGSPASQGGAGGSIGMPEAQAAQPSQTSQNNDINQVLKQQLSPYQEMVKKHVDKGIGTQVQEAMAQGVPGDHILQQLGLNQQQNNQNNTPQNNQPQSIQPGMTVTPATSGFAMGGVDVKNGQVNFKQPGTLGQFLGGTDRTKELLEQAGMLQNLIGGQAVQPIQKIEAARTLMSGQMQAINEQINAEKANATNALGVMSDTSRILSNPLASWQTQGQAKETFKQSLTMINGVYGPGGSMEKLYDNLSNVHKTYSQVLEQSLGRANQVSQNVKNQQFIEGKTYKDANGNTAIYKNGKFQ